MMSDTSDPRVWPKEASIFLSIWARESPLTLYVGLKNASEFQAAKKNTHPALEESSESRNLGDLPKVKYKMWSEEQPEKESRLSSPSPSVVRFDTD